MNVLSVCAHMRCENTNYNMYSCLTEGHRLRGILLCMVYSQIDPPSKQKDMHIPGIDFIAREHKDMTYTTSIPSE